MKNQGEFDNESFAGVLRCNDWRIDLGRIPDPLSAGKPPQT